MNYLHFLAYETEYELGAIVVLLFILLLLRLRREEKIEILPPEQKIEPQVPPAQAKEAYTEEPEKLDSVIEPPPVIELAEEAARVEPVKAEKKLKSTADRLFGRIRTLFQSGKPEREAIFKTLEESLIAGDVGVKTTDALLSDLKLSAHQFELNEIEAELRKRMRSMFDSRDGTEIDLQHSPAVVVMVGVNGVGKTTTAGKLAQRFSAAGKKVLLGACDTFRAAAVEQLRLWGERTGVEVIFGGDAVKPSTVAYNAVQKALNDKVDLLILDTAGRLHTKGNLMQELEAVLRLIAREIPGAPHETILVVDATSGQNALIQAQAFHAAAPLTGLVVTKLDGTPRGGMLFAIRKELGTPVRYIGVGERAEDLKQFDAEQFLDELFAPSDLAAMRAELTIDLSPNDTTPEEPVRRKRRSA